MIKYRQIETTLAPYGLMARGGFHPQDSGELGAKTIVLVGNAGPDMYSKFADSTEHKIGEPHPLNAWTRRVLNSAANRLDAEAHFPFDGPPWLPFQQWAQRSEGVSLSPLGMLMHPVFGLWHAYRGALAFAEKMELPEITPAPSHCETCFEKPCLTACPVNAFEKTVDGLAYDVSACAAHVDSEAGADCLQNACRARRACPVGRGFHYGPGQSRFHMVAFVAAQQRKASQ